MADLPLIFSPTTLVNRLFPAPLPHRKQENIDHLSTRVHQLRSRKPSSECSYLVNTYCTLANE